MTERHIIIGDVHGTIDEFNELVDKLEITSNDVVISCGDLVDKGPDSPAVVKRAGEMVNHLVLGNHEEKHERFRRSLINGSGNEKLRGYDEMASITAGLNQADVDWLNKATLYHKFSSRGRDFLVVHAGISPRMNDLPDLEKVSKMTNSQKKKLGSYNQLLRLRFVNEGGHFVMLGDEKPTDQFWANIYDGRFGHVFFGHQPFLQESPKIFTHATGLDLGCVLGGKLCAAIVSSDSDEIKYVTVEAAKQYCEPYVMCAVDPLAVNANFGVTGS